jgi:hypothetical protein
MDSFPLPEFTFHEASLLTLLLTGPALPDLRIPPEATEDDELKRITPRRAASFVKRFRQEVAVFLSGLADLDLSEFWDFKVDEFRRKLEELNEMQNVRLYFALKKYFWECDKYETQAEALCEAGFFPKESLPFAQKEEILDSRRRLSRLIGERRR